MVQDTIERTTQELADRLVKEMFVLSLSHNGYSLKEIGEIIGVGEKRVSQIKRKALLRVKRELRKYTIGNEKI